jgi:hypothetical protein
MNIHVPLAIFWGRKEGGNLIYLAEAMPTEKLMLESKRAGSGDFRVDFRKVGKQGENRS